MTDDLMFYCEQFWQNDLSETLANNYNISVYEQKYQHICQKRN